MIQRFVPDIVSVCLIALVAVLLAVRPNVNTDVRPQVVTQAGAQLKTFNGQLEQKGIEQKSILAVAISAEALQKRNIFAASGSYAAIGAETSRPLAENPSVLIGILGGKERKAVFRDGKGAVAAFVVGETMGDGVIIARIDKMSVKLVKGKETKELKIFNVQYKPPLR